MKKIFIFALAALLLVSFAGCSSTDDKTIVIGASPIPHAEILESIKEELASQGYTLEIKEFTDYVLPNTALASGDLDANFFQHEPFLNKFIEEKETDLVVAAKVHFEPYGIYPGTSDSLADIPDGAVIGVPNDPSNEARALQLLEANGLLKLKEGVGLEATPKDIVENPHHIEIRELEAAAITINLPDLNFAVVNGNYAIDAGILDQVLAREEIESAAADEFVNVVAVRAEDLNSPKIQALVEAINSEAVRTFIEETYHDQFLVKF